jgi:hypothetical protein
VALTDATLTYVGRLVSPAVTERVSADLLKSRDTLVAAPALQNVSAKTAFT